MAASGPINHVLLAGAASLGCGHTRWFFSFSFDIETVRPKKRQIVSTESVTGKKKGRRRCRGRWHPVTVRSEFLPFVFGITAWLFASSWRKWSTPWKHRLVHMDFSLTVLGLIQCVVFTCTQRNLPVCATNISVTISDPCVLFVPEAWRCYGILFLTGWPFLIGSVRLDVCKHGSRTLMCNKTVSEQRGAGFDSVWTLEFAVRLQLTQRPEQTSLICSAWQQSPRHPHLCLSSLTI